MHKAKKPFVNGKDRSKRWTSAEFNDTTYFFYLNWFLNIAMNCFEWINLPKTCDPRFLELKILSTGSSLLLKDEVIGFINLPVMLDGELSIYDIPTHRVAYASNGTQYDRDYTNSVIVYDNYMHQIPLEGLEMFAWRIANIERTMDTNITTLKTPVLIKTPEAQLLSMKNLFMKYEGNVPFLFGDKNLNLDGIEALQLGVPIVFPQLDTQRKEYINSALNYLGIETTSSEKKERMVTEEAMGNLGIVKTNRFLRLNARKQACDEFNRMFGEKLDVKFRKDMAVINLDSLFEFPTQGQRNEQLEKGGKDSE